ncbi:MAG: peptidylprolyl isomerase [Chitinophagaceae bacterium]
MKPILFVLGIFIHLIGVSQPTLRIKEKDRKKDVILVTDSGSIRIHLYEATPVHRDNFLSLVKAGFYDGIAFHRIIQEFMIQAGNMETRLDKKLLRRDSAKYDYTIPAEFRTELFHKRGVLAAARMGDDVNPTKASSGTQFYLVQGRKFSDKSLDSVENFRLKRKIPIEQRALYQSLGGAPHLDQSYTVFGEVVEGMEVIDKIASIKTSGRMGGDRPLTDIRIQRAYLVKKKP